MKRKITIAIVVSLSASALLNAAAWVLPGFSDWYAEKLFPIVTAPLAHLTSLLPFSLGEWMLPAAALWLLVLAAAAGVCLISFLFGTIRRRRAGAGPSAAAENSGQTAAPAGPEPSAGERARLRGTGRCGRFTRRFLRATCLLLAVVVPVMTLNCFVLYHTTPIEESLAGYGREYTIEELGQLRDYIVEKCNLLAEQMPRDADGEVVYEGGADAMEEAAKEAVAALGQMEELPDVMSRLAGWQTTPKTLYFSGFVSQQYIQGYYFPFSMESNYNSVMKIMNKPSTMCHELAHTHGFIYEDEANLIGFLACIYSEDVIFQYSGWLSVLYYVNNSYYANVDEATYRAHPSISDRVRFDNEFLSDEAWEEVEEDAILDTQTVRAATDTYLDTTLKANGVESGKASYTHVVELLLMYYDGVYP